MIDFIGVAISIKRRTVDKIIVFFTQQFSILKSKISFRCKKLIELINYVKSFAYNESYNEPYKEPTAKSDKIKQSIQKFWDENVCGYKPETNFDDHDKNRLEQYPYLFKEIDTKNDKNKMVLEIGIGTASDACFSFQYSKPKSYVLLDISKNTLNVAKSHLKCHCQNKNFELINGDVEELGFKNETFDRVKALGSLHHTPNTRKALEEIFRVLKKEGDFIFMFYNKDSVRYRVTYENLAKERSVSINNLILEIEGKENPFTSVFSKNQIKKMCKDLGFSDLSIKTRELLPEEEEKLGIISKLVEKRYGFALYVRGRK